MNLNRFLTSLFCLLFSSSLLGQKTGHNQDSIQASNHLDEVVVTGENKVMSLSKKLFAVGVLDAKDIAQVAGNTPSRYSQL